MDFQVQKVFQTKPDKKVPTHGPGTSAFYRGKVCKVLSIANGKAKIFVDGRILIVNYTSLDDQMYGKMSEGFRVVNEKTHKSLFTGSQDECDDYVKENDLEEDEDKMPSRLVAYMSSDSDDNFKFENSGDVMLSSTLRLSSSSEDDLDLKLPKPWP